MLLVSTTLVPHKKNRLVEASPLQAMLMIKFPSKCFFPIIVTIMVAQGSSQETPQIKNTVYLPTIT